MQEVTQIIQTFGFPIACVIALSWFVYKMTNDERKETQKREDRMYSQLDKFSDSLDKFSDTLSKIDERLAVLEHSIVGTPKK